MTKTLKQEIEEVISRIEQVPLSKNYWFIRTQSGQYYETFLRNGFVAIEHTKITMAELDRMAKTFGKDLKGLRKAVLELVKKRYEEEIKPGLIVNQIIRFLSLEKGDTILIPSHNSNEIAIGKILSSGIPVINDEIIEKTECNYDKRKLVKWIKRVRKNDLDPYLYRMLTAHQAVNNINAYANFIERTTNNFYIQNNEGSMVLQVLEEGGINAKDLFTLGSGILNYAQAFFDEHQLDMSIDDVEVKITLNSKGLLQFKAQKASTVWMIAVLSVAINGGGLKIDTAGFKLDLSTEGIIQKVIDYQNSQKNQEITDKINHSMDSLKVVVPTDAVKLLENLPTKEKKE